jgi:hypothetical protein
MSTLRDLAVNRRIHPVYLFGLPALVLCQAGMLFTLTVGTREKFPTSTYQK